jgi:uncharacterized protein
MDERTAAAVMDDAVNRAAFSEVERLLNQGINPNVRDITGDPVIISAAWVGAADIVQLLIDRGADVNARGNDGNNALQRLLSENNQYWYEGHERVVETLRRSGSQE